MANLNLKIQLVPATIYCPQGFSQNNIHWSVLNDPKLVEIKQDEACKLAGEKSGLPPLGTQTQKPLHSKL